MSNVLNGNEVESGVLSYSQVYSATHDGAGNRLPYMQKSFISFSYGGKLIEDFDLIVVNGNDRLSQALYAPFEDSTTDYLTVDGQYYWGTHLKANAKQFVLATDEIDESKLDAFKKWFKPGIARELILSEHPNRAIMARVAEPPAMEMLPFEKKVTHIINGVSYETSTTVYRGNIVLNLVMDNPTWYAKLNYMPYYVDKTTLEPLTDTDTNTNKIITLEDKDMIKIMHEDNIPHQSVLKGNVFLGGNLLVKEEALTNQAQVNITHLDVTTDVSNVTIGPDNTNPAYLFYSGTARSYPIIKFSIAFPCEDDNNGAPHDSAYSNRYLERPKNTYYDSGVSYSNITLSYNGISQEFRFTTPSILTGYNQAVNTIKSMIGSSTTDIINALKEKVTEKYSRAWAIASMKIAGSQTTTTANSLTNAINTLESFINPEVPATFIINSKTGEAVGHFSVKVKTNTINVSNTPYTEVTENIGDMIRSDYLVLEERNQFNENGEITLNNCYKITSDLQLTNVLFLYENMYL